MLFRSQAAAHGIDLVGLVQIHHFPVHRSRILLEFLPQFGDLGLQLLHVLHGLHALLGHGPEDRLDDDGEQNDGHSLTGKAFGKRKILPKISPNKTIAGFLGGLLLSPILSMAIGSLLVLPISLLSLGLIGFFLSFCGFWGDVTFSYLKRRAGVKDTSTLIPGHGGLLDRIDSLL